MRDPELDAEIQQTTYRIKDLQFQLLELISRKQVKQDLTVAQVLAEFLHKSTCRWNHTDGCGWYYRDDWTDYEHKKYLAIAERLLVLGPAETVMPIISTIRDCQ